MTKTTREEKIVRSGIYERAEEAYAAVKQQSDQDLIYNLKWWAKFWAAVLLVTFIVWIFQ